MDMDLDELDQAVNKLMDQPKGKRSAPRREAVPVRPATPPTPVQDDSVTVKVDATPPAAPMPKPSPMPASDSGGHTIPVSRPMPRVPERRRMHPGAMDIIQPSSGPKAAAPSARPARVASDVTPTSPVKPEPPKPVVPDTEPSPSDVSDEVLASLSLLDDSHKALAVKPASEPKKEGREKWPDPLDFHNFDDKSDKKEKAPEELPPTLAPEPVKDEEIAQNTTPFVTTKVDKRPLGAYAGTVDPPKPAIETPPKADLAETSLQSSQHVAPAATTTPAEEPEHDMDDLRQMAIPPQYHTAEPDKNDDVHNVYDTKEYHAAPQMMPVAHKSSPWVSVSIVVLVVLIIAALAVGYFMMTGTFDITRLW